MLIFAAAGSEEFRWQFLKDGMTFTELQKFLLDRDEVCKQAWLYHLSMCRKVHAFQNDISKFQMSAIVKSKNIVALNQEQLFEKFKKLLTERSHSDFCSMIIEQLEQSGLPVNGLADEDAQRMCHWFIGTTMRLAMEAFTSLWEAYCNVKSNELYPDIHEYRRVNRLRGDA